MCILCVVHYMELTEHKLDGLKTDFMADIDISVKGV